ncbi:hypothetical protein [Parachlamydia sp. AcF125]|uniref:hypothetical protein n=1 Tax=Parachlamydia sp. AcF125 TaxID=2795736 RepID=UPI001BCA5772|nr:hypothetical protein [Parachlamydia sp. AcF125]MBS4168621.1 hypothetical protein [Parachlamydia sp. AcF125]
MTITQILKKIAYLETINKALHQEVLHLDVMMRQLGFSGGLETVKLTARAILKDKKQLRKHKK